MSAYLNGNNAGALSALYGASEPAAVSIPSEYLGGELPKAWDGWTEAAHEYARGFHAGWANVVSFGKHGVAKFPE